MRDVTKSAVRNVLAVYTDTLKGAAGGSFDSFAIEIEPGDKLTSMASAQGMDFSWLNSVKLDYVTGSVDGNPACSIGLFLNDTEICTLDYILDQNNQQMLMGLGGLSDMLYASRLPSQLSSLSDIDMDIFVELIEKYVDVVLDQIEDVESGSGTITANGVTADCTVYTIRIDQEVATKIAKAVVNTMLDDPQLKEFLEKLYPSMDVSDQYSGFEDYYENVVLKRLRDYLQQIEANASQVRDEVVTITEYVSGGTLVGFRISPYMIGTYVYRDSSSISLAIPDSPVYNDDSDDGFDSIVYDGDGYSFGFDDDDDDSGRITIGTYGNDSDTQRSATKRSSEFFYGLAIKDGQFGYEMTVTETITKGTDIKTKEYAYIKGSGTVTGEKLNGSLYIYNGLESSDHPSPLMKIELIDWDYEDKEGAFELSFTSDGLSRMGVNRTVRAYLAAAKLRVTRESSSLSVEVFFDNSSVLKVTLGPSTRSISSISADGTITNDMSRWLGSVDYAALKERLQAAGMPASLIDQIFSKVVH